MFDDVVCWDSVVARRSKTRQDEARRGETSALRQPCLRVYKLGSALGIFLLGQNWFFQPPPGRLVLPSTSLQPTFLVSEPTAFHSPRTLVDPLFVHVLFHSLSPFSSLFLSFPTPSLPLVLLSPRLSRTNERSAMMGWFARGWCTPARGGDARSSSQKSIFPSPVLSVFPTFCVQRHHKRGYRSKCRRRRRHSGILTFSEDQSSLHELSPPIVSSASAMSSLSSLLISSIRRITVREESIVTNRIIQAGKALRRECNYPVIATVQLSLPCTCTFVKASFRGNFSNRNFQYNLLT